MNEELMDARATLLALQALMASKLDPVAKVRAIKKMMKN